jgi:signal transduction histidine kinase
MNKLGAKIAISVSAVILSLLVCLLLVSHFFLRPYYLHQTKQRLLQISQELADTSTENLPRKIESLNQHSDVAIVAVPRSQSLDALNEYASHLLSRQGVSLNRFWITAEVISQLDSRHSVNKIYDQKKQKSSFYVRYITKGNDIILIGISLAHMNEIIQMVNQFNGLLFTLALVVTLIWVWAFSRRITKPLDQLKRAAQEIADLKFQQVAIQTNDEIEELAHSINQMSQKLQQAHQELTQKNQDLKRLTADVTHELKTPLALIQAYSMGIKDDLDDGTYLDTIVSQAERMSSLIDQLLSYAKLEQDPLHLTLCHPVALWESCLAQHRVIFETKKITCHYTEPPQPDQWHIRADPEKLKMVFHNLLRNATKYTDNGQIEIHWSAGEQHLFLHIANGLAQETKHLNHIWKPFFVLDEARDKGRSGTGLGLAVVKTILERHGYSYNVKQHDGWITFSIGMTLVPHTDQN